MPGKALCKASEPDGLALFGLDLFPQVLSLERSARHFQNPIAPIASHVRLPRHVVRRFFKNQAGLNNANYQSIGSQAPRL
jgi:hypothetical protein